MALTDTAIKAAKPGVKSYKMADSGGLYLLVQPSGGKWWRFDYRIDGKRKTISMGVYPDVSLKDARSRRDEARKSVANGVDPSLARQASRAARVEACGNSFEAVAREWWGKQAPGWKGSHAEKIIRRLENDVFPWLGGRPVADIRAPDVLSTIRRIEDRGALDTAHRALQNCGQVFRYAVATGRIQHNPASDLRGALPPRRTGHFPALTEPQLVGELLRAIDGFKGSHVVRSALRLGPMLFVRPGELRCAEWADFDLEKGEWNIPTEQMKSGRPHLVPLAKQAIEILRDLKPLTGRYAHVFSGRDPKKPMSGAAVNAALRRMGYDTKTEITGHGFRAMARTILHEQLGVDRDVIEHQLAHRVPDPLGTAYNRTKFLKERRTMMQTWADYLDQLRAAGEVVQFSAKDAA